MKLFTAFVALFGLVAADDTCTIADYSNNRVSSWRTNCPSGCAIYEYLEETSDKLNDDWNKLERKFSTIRSNGLEDLHVHLRCEIDIALNMYSPGEDTTLTTLLQN